MAYAAISQRKLAETDAKIPSEWRLSESQIPPGMLSPAESITNVKQYGRVNVMDIPRTCGLLSARELEITEQYDVRGLLRAMTDKRLTAEEVTTAFCKVRCPRLPSFLTPETKHSLESSHCTPTHPLPHRTALRPRHPARARARRSPPPHRPPHRALTRPPRLRQGLF